MLPDLVRNDDEVVDHGKFGNQGQFLTIEQPPGGIVGIVEDDRLGAGRDGGLQRGTLDPPARRLQRNLDRKSPCPSD